MITYNVPHNGITQWSAIIIYFEIVRISNMYNINKLFEVVYIVNYPDLITMCHIHA